MHTYFLWNYLRNWFCLTFFLWSISHYKMFNVETYEHSIAVKKRLRGILKQIVERVLLTCRWNLIDSFTVLFPCLALSVCPVPILNLLFPCPTLFHWPIAMSYSVTLSCSHFLLCVTVLFPCPTLSHCPVPMSYSVSLSCSHVLLCHTVLFPCPTLSHCLVPMSWFCLQMNSTLHPDQPRDNFPSTHLMKIILCVHRKPIILGVRVAALLLYNECT